MGVQYRLGDPPILAGQPNPKPVKLGVSLFSEQPSNLSHRPDHFLSKSSGFCGPGDGPGELRAISSLGLGLS